MRRRAHPKRTRSRCASLCGEERLAPGHARPADAFGRFSQAAAEAMPTGDIGTPSAPTAFGKTLLRARLIAARKVNALVLGPPPPAARPVAGPPVHRRRVSRPAAGHAASGHACRLAGHATAVRRRPHRLNAAKRAVQRRGATADPFRERGIVEEGAPLMRRSEGEAMIAEVVGRLVRQSDPDRILLFGSRARAQPEYRLRPGADS